MMIAVSIRQDSARMPHLTEAWFAAMRRVVSCVVTSAPSQPGVGVLHHAEINESFARSRRASARRAAERSTT